MTSQRRQWGRITALCTHSGGRIVTRAGYHSNMQRHPSHAIRWAKWAPWAEHAGKVKPRFCDVFELCRAESIRLHPNAAPMISSWLIMCSTDSVLLLFIALSFHPSDGLSVCLPLCRPTDWSIYRFVHQSIHLSVNIVLIPSNYISICLSVWRSVYPSNINTDHYETLIPFLLAPWPRLTKKSRASRKWHYLVHHR